MLQHAAKSMRRIGALSLTLYCAYDLYTRLDAMLPVLNMFIRMWIGEKIPFARAVRYIDFGIFALPLFLFLGMLLGLLTLLFARKKGVPLLIMHLALAAFGFAIRFLGVNGLLPVLRAVPALLCLLSYPLMWLVPRRLQALPNSAAPRFDSATPEYNPFSLRHRAQQAEKEKIHQGSSDPKDC